MRNWSRATWVSRSWRAGARAAILALWLAVGASLISASAACASKGVWEAAAAARRTAIVIIADGLELEFIHRSEPGPITGLGSFALVSSRAAVVGDPASYALTAASGVPITAQGVDVQFAPAGAAYGAETAGSAYARRSGRDRAAQPLADTAVVAPDWFELVSANKESPYNGRPGLVGESLRMAGLKTAAISAADPADLAAVAVGPSAGLGLAFLFAADAAGTVDWADTGSQLTAADPGAPMGLRTDAAAVAGAVRRALADPGVALVVIDCDDVARALDEAESVAEGLRPSMLGQAYRNLDDVIGAALGAAADSRSDVELFVLSLRNRRGCGLMLSQGGGGAAPGLLTSATTRRAGLVALVDVASTVLGAVGVEPAWHGLGAPALAAGGDGSSGSDAWAALTRLERDIVAQESARPATLNVFTGSAVVALVLCIAALAYPRRPRALMDLAAVALAAACVSPAVLILAPLTGLRGAPAILALMFTVSLLIGGLVLGRGHGAGKGRSLTVTVEAFTAVWTALILGDALGGGALARSSVLGHSAIIGARFYGLGNELMGVMLGAGIVAASALWRRATSARWRQWGWALVAGAAALMAAVLGSPSYGSNFGGMVSAAVAAAAALWLGAPRKGVVAAAGGIVLVGLVATLLWANATSGGTHIARAVSLARSAAGRSELMAIAQRKVAMNIRLMKYTSWTRLLWALLASVLCLAGGGFTLAAEHRLAVLAALAGALAALAVNDSGVVACATAAMAPGFLLMAHAVDAAAARR